MFQLQAASLRIYVNECMTGFVPWGVATCDEMTQSEAVGTLVLTHTPVMEKEPMRTASDVGYDQSHAWIKSILGPVHATVRGTVAWGCAVCCVPSGSRRPSWL